jgi:hypothetical protein
LSWIFLAVLQGKARVCAASFGQDLGLLDGDSRAHTSFHFDFRSLPSAIARENNVASSGVFSSAMVSATKRGDTPQEGHSKSGAVQMSDMAFLRDSLLENSVVPLRVRGFSFVFKVALRVLKRLTR